MSTKFDIASNMNNIMGSPEHKAVFAKPAPPSMTKTAAKKDDSADKAKALKDCVAECKKVMKVNKCKGTVKAEDGKCVIMCDDKDSIKECKSVCKKHKVPCVVQSQKKAMYADFVTGLARISETLDDEGFDKAAAYVVLALDSLVSQGMPTGKLSSNDCGHADDKKKDEDDKDEEKEDKKMPPWLKDKKKDDKEDDDKDEKDEDEDDVANAPMVMPEENITATPYDIVDPWTGETMTPGAGAGSTPLAGAPGDPLAPLEGDPNLDSIYEMPDWMVKEREKAKAQPGWGKPDFGNAQASSKKSSLQKLANELSKKYPF